jgi:Spy/CpxP family protein refolding chaperone
MTTRSMRVFVVIGLLLITVLPVSFAAAPTGRATAALEQLNLTADQKAKLRDFIRTSKQGTQNDRKGITAERQRLMSLYCNYDLNTTQAQKSISKINSLELDLLNRRLDRRLRVRSVLTPDQFVRFRKIMDKTPRAGNRIDEELPRSMGQRRGPLPKLNLSADQQQKIQNMWQSQRAEQERVLQSMNQDLKSMEQLFAKYHVDERAVGRLILSVNKDQLRILQLRLNRQIQLRKIINEQQFQALAQHIKQNESKERRGRED